MAEQLRLSGGRGRTSHCYKNPKGRGLIEWKLRPRFGIGAQAFDPAQNRRRSNKPIRGRGRALSRPRGPRRTLASNNSERDRGKAYRSEISHHRRTNPASQRRRAMTSFETSRKRLTNVPTRCQLELRPPHRPRREASGRSGIEICKELEVYRSKFAKVVLVGQGVCPKVVPRSIFSG